MDDCPELEQSFQLASVTMVSNQQQQVYKLARYHPIERASWSSIKPCYSIQYIIKRLLLSFQGLQSAVWSTRLTIVATVVLLQDIQPTDRYVVITQGYSPVDPIQPINQKDLPCSSSRQDSVTGSETSSTPTFNSKVKQLFRRCKNRLSRLSTSSSSENSSRRSSYCKSSSGSFASTSSSEDTRRRCDISSFNYIYSDGSSCSNASSSQRKGSSDSSCTLTGSSQSSSGNCTLTGISHSSKVQAQHSRVVFSAKALAAEMQHWQEALAAMTAFSNWCGVSGSVQL